VACYYLKYRTWLKYNINHMYINSWASSPCKPVFNGRLYPKFVSVTFTVMPENTATVALGLFQIGVGT
jgi:hypothetical protein